jgi:alpha-tubulin suppressor-like RCC1 family protein
VPPSFLYRDRRTAPLSRRNVARLAVGSILCVLVLAGTSALPSAASSKVTAAKISAHLTKTSFTSSQARSVKLVYKFSGKSKSFSYKLTFKKSSRWQKVKSFKSVKKKGSFKGTHKMTVKKLFGGKAMKIGKYRVKLAVDKGSKTLPFNLKKGPSGTGGNGGAIHSAPVNTAAPAISGTAAQGQALSTTNGSWGTTNPPTSYAYQWRRCDGSGANCTDISGATASSYTLVYADAGGTVQVVVTAANAYGSTPATSDKYPASGTIGGNAPVNTALPAISGTAAQGQALTTTNGSWDNSPTSHSYRWQRCNGTSCTDISGATASSYTLVYADAGRTVQVVVTAANAYGSTPATSGKYPAGGTIGGDPPVNTALPAILGTAAQGQTLSTDGGAWDNPPADSSGYGYQWQSCDNSGANCTDISGETQSTYLLSDTDVDSTIRVVVTATNPYGSADATSAQTDVVVATGAPVNKVAPAISGTPTQGQTLNTSQGNWVPAATSYSYQWKQCDSSGNNCINIGTDSSSYTLVAGDFGHTIRVIVTASNSEGSGAATSDHTGIVTTNPSVSSGGDHSCVLHADGTIDCWGWNYDGALGNGFPPVDSAAPVPVFGIDNAVQVSAGWFSACALLSDGTVRCWGYNEDGELGDGTGTDGQYPVTVITSPSNPLSDVVQMSAGNYHACAVKSDGTVWCWGYNDSGQLGDNSTTESKVAVEVSNIDSATQVSAGGYHTCALLSNGTVWCWGYGGDGQLGDGSNPYASSLTPVQASGITNATQVSVGGYHSCALLANDTIDCWGYDYDGQLGNLNTADSPSPVLVNGISGATQVSAGWYNTCAVLSSTVKCWGWNAHGELGDGSTNHGTKNGVLEDISLAPVLVSGISNATVVGTGGGWKDTTRGGHTCALLSTGAVKCWGWNLYGQLGNGTMTDSPTPVTVIFGAPWPEALPAISGTTQQGQTLSTNGGTWIGATGGYTYQWERCDSTGSNCANISGATASTYLLVAGDVGSTVRVLVTASNGSGSTKSLSDQTVTIHGPGPVNTVLPVISGVATQGQTLNTTHGSWTPSTGITYSYQWERCDSLGANCSNIGTNSSSYTLVSGDVGHTVRVVVTATNGSGSTPATSSQFPASGTISGLTAPVNTGLPIISDTTPRVNHSISTTDGTWDNSPTSFSYQWERCDGSGNNCSNISGQTSDHYTPGYSDRNNTLRVVVTAHNAAGSTPAESAATSPVTT